MKELAQRIVDAGIVDTHVLQQMKTWGLDVSRPSSEKQQQIKANLMAFLEDIQRLVDRDVESDEEPVVLDPVDLPGLPVKSAISMRLVPRGPEADALDELS